MKHAVALLVFHPDNSGRVLAISRGSNLQDWGLVAGKVESGETLEQALRREAQEEALVSFLPFPLIPIFTSKTKTRMTTTFMAQRGGVLVLEVSEIPVTREGTVAWKHPSDLCTKSCSYRDYNWRLFKHLGVFWMAEPIGDLLRAFDAYMDCQVRSGPLSSDADFVVALQALRKVDEPDENVVGLLAAYDSCQTRNRLTADPVFISALQGLRVLYRHLTGRSRQEEGSGGP